MNGYLKAEFEFFLSQQKELLRQYPGKVLAIKNKTVLGVYGDQAEAIRETKKVIN